MKTTALLICILINLGSSNYQAQKIAKYTKKYTAKWNIDPQLAISVMYNESRLNNRVKHKTNDYGIMGIHCPYKKYAPWCKNIKKLKTLHHNIRTGIYIMHRKKQICADKPRHKSHHWLKHYNWYSKYYVSHILTIKKCIGKIINGCIEKNYKRLKDRRTEECIRIWKKSYRCRITRCSTFNIEKF